MESPPIPPFLVVQLLIYLKSAFIQSKKQCSQTKNSFQHCFWLYLELVIIWIYWEM